MLRRIFGPMRVEVTGGWRKLHDEELHNLYSELDIIKMISLWRLVAHVACTGHMRNTYRILVRKPERKRPFRRSSTGGR
jgi:hypothetical protein